MFETIGSPGASSIIYSPPLAQQSCVAPACSVPEPLTGQFISSDPAPPPPIVATTPAAAAQACAAGWQVDASGVCTRYSDNDLVNGANTIQWAGDGSIPGEQLTRVQARLLSAYGNQPQHIGAGSVLAYVYGVGGSAPEGTVITADNGYTYRMTSGVWQLSTAQTAPVTNPPAASNTPAPASYTPSSDDLFIYGAIGAQAPYSQTEVNFAQAVESAGSPVSSLFTQAAIAAAYQAYVSGGGSIYAAQQSLVGSVSAGSGSGAAASSPSSSTILLIGGIAVAAFLFAGKKS